MTATADVPPDMSGFALVVVDVQKVFNEPAWGPRNNPACDESIEALIRHWADHERPLVYVRHSSRSRSSGFHPDAPGHAFKDYLRPTPGLVVTKSVNSAFHGTPDLDTWLRQSKATGIVVCGITTNHCCETTARVGDNLGHRVLFALDATHTFDRTGPDGRHYGADQLARVTAANLHGEFAQIVTTRDLLERPADGTPPGPVPV